MVTHSGFFVRLACIKHAASVRPEPGSNSPTKDQSFRPEGWNPRSSICCRVWLQVIGQNRPPASDISALSDVIVYSSTGQPRRDEINPPCLGGKTDLCGTLFSCQGAETLQSPVRAPRRTPGRWVGTVHPLVPPVKMRPGPLESLPTLPCGFGAAGELQGCNFAAGSLRHAPSADVSTPF